MPSILTAIIQTGQTGASINNSLRNVRNVCNVYNIQRRVRCTGAPGLVCSETKTNACRSQHAQSSMPRAVCPEQKVGWMPKYDDMRQQQEVESNNSFNPLGELGNTPLRHAPSYVMGAAYNGYNGYNGCALQQLSTHSVEPINNQSCSGSDGLAGTKG